MIKEIKYGGYTASPSDYDSPDGDLAALMNLVKDDYGLNAIRNAAVVYQPNSNDMVVYIHETSVYKHLIILNSSTNSVRWVDIVSHPNGTKTYEDGGKVRDFASTIKFFKFSSIGNILLILTDVGIQYCLWERGMYDYLGTHIPEMPISFGLKAESIKEADTAGGDNVVWSDGHVNTSYRDHYMALINNFIVKYTKKHKFIMPFFVRYAYRLYDGSLHMASAPVFMCCATGAVPYIMIKGMESEHSNVRTEVFAAVHTLDYAVTQQYAIDQVQKWKDIVKSVDIFISKPIYKIDINNNDFLWKTSGGAERLTKIESVCKRMTNVGSSWRPTSCFPNPYQRTNYFDLYDLAFPYSNTEAKVSDEYLKPRERNQEEFLNDIKNCHDFYFLASIPIEELSTERKDVPMPTEEEYMVTATLVQKENMASSLNEFRSHDTLVPRHCYVYNNRLNISNIYRKLFYGYDMATQMQFTDGYVFDKPNVVNGVHQSNESLAWNNNRKHICFYFFIREEDEKEYVVAHHKIYQEEKRSGQVYGRYGAASVLRYIFFPNSRAYKCVVDMYDSADPDGTIPIGGKYCMQVELKPHDFLDGAYWFDMDGIEQDKYGFGNASPTLSDNALVNITSKVYTSEVNNPFIFPVTGINTVGTGVILSLCSATKALSQGQFGQFPLYAFTTEGVWAMEVSSTGLYSAKQPITRDVCINADSITQLDSAVLFTTDRGIMLISGSNSQCISDTIDYPQVFSIDSMPQADKLVTMAGFKDEDFAYVPFRDYLLGCRMIYAYTQQRVIVYNPAHSYAYVYSLKTKTWGMMQSSVADNVPSYPEALAMLKDGTLVDFCTDAAQQQDEDGHLQGIKGLLITRPLKLDAPDLLKTIDTAIQRGNFRKGSIKSALYGSRDLQNWSLIWTSQDHYLRGFRGTPYKYFRFALLCDMQPDESLFGATIQYTPRLLNQPR